MANKLVNIIRHLVKEEINEMAGPAFLLKIVDKDKAERLKRLHAGTWVADMIDILIKVGDTGITRKRDKKTGKEGLSDLLNKIPESLNLQIKALQDNGVVSRDRLTPEKPQKEPGTGGKKPNDKSREGIIRTLFKNFTENPDFEPTEDDLIYNLPKGAGTEKLAPELFNKVKNKALGLTKRGRPKPQAESLQEMYLRLQRKK